MKVALVSPYAWDRPGGVQTHVRALSEALRHRGHQVIVLAPFARAGDAGGAVRVGRAVSIPANGSVAPLSFGPVGARRIKSVLRDLAPDVVHLHEPLVPSSSLLALVSADAPTVGTFHASAEQSNAYRVARPLLERAVRRLHVRTAVSEAARRFASRYFPGDYELTPNGIDVAGFSNASPERISTGPVVLFLNRLERRKGLDVLIRAMAHLHDLEATLVVAGTGPEESKARRLAASLEVDAIWLGAIEHGRIPGVYAGADVYCAPAVGGESFGIVLLEAMAAGVPVVCSDLDAFRSVVADAAATTRTGDAADLAAALRGVLTNPERAAALTEAGRRRADEFAWSRLVVPVEELYERAAGGSY